MQEDLVRKLTREQLNVEPIHITVLVGGQVGHVYRVDTTDKCYVIKLVDVWEEPPFSEEPRNDRVYGSRFSNLLPAYKLLQQNRIPVPILYASGTKKKKKLHYVIVEYLNGDVEDYSDSWFAVIGKELGTIHRINRSYQGWVGMGTPYSENWAEAFTKSLESQLLQVQPFMEKGLYDLTAKYLTEITPISNPQAFVLSHTDGFQGVLKRTGDEWRLVGVVDIEDYQFTDQRFVLSGFELSHSMENRVVPESFWKAYSYVNAIDSTYDESKDLFKIYYLLVWIRVLTEQPEPQSKCLTELLKIVRE